MPFDATPIETKPADVFSLASLIAWLEKQPADRRYQFSSCTHCLLGQYLTECVKGFTAVGTFDFSTDLDGVFKTDNPLPPHFNEIARSVPWTFGAALSRARALVEG